MPVSRPIQKVLLVFPPITTPRFLEKICCLPMGIAYLGAALRDRYEVCLLDAVVEGHHLDRELGPQLSQYGLDPAEIQRWIEAFQPDVLGVTTLFSNQFPTMAEIVRRAKAWNPDLITITGGTHPSFLPERSLRREPALDYIVLGEADESLPALLETLAQGKSPAELDGIAYRENGAVRVNPKTRYVQNLDTLPFPARDLLPVEKYFEINVPLPVLLPQPPKSLVYHFPRLSVPLHLLFFHPLLGQPLPGALPGERAGRDGAPDREIRGGGTQV